MYLHTAQYGSPPGIAKRLDKLFDNMGGLPAQSLISLLSFASGSLWFISQPIPAIHYLPPPPPPLFGQRTTAGCFGPVWHAASTHAHISFGSGDMEGGYGEWKGCIQMGGCSGTEAWNLVHRIPMVKRERS